MPLKKNCTLRRSVGSKMVAINPKDKGIDFESVIHEEYMRLHRTYRLMEDVRHSLLEKGNKAHGKLLDFLMERKRDVELDLRNASDEDWKQKDRITTATMLQILEEYEYCLQDVVVCHKDILEMETNVDKITKRLIEQQLKVQALYGRSMTVQQAARKKSRLEEKLFQIVVKFDKILAGNEAYRNEIDILLKERRIFHTRVVHLRKQANRIKRGMGEIVYLATKAYEERDDIVTKIRAIRERNEKDSKQHVLEVKEFNRVLHHDSKLHGFMNTKNQMRDLIESTQDRDERKNHKMLTELIQKLEAYQKTFKEILSIDAKGLNSDQLVSQYMENEQVNFSNFRFLTDLNNEIDSLYLAISQMKMEIDDLHLQRHITDTERSSNLDNISSSYKEKGEQLDTVINIWEQSEVQLEEYIKLLNIVFKTAHCDKTPIMRLLGNLHGITPHNALLCMNVIETRINDLMFEKQELELRKAVEINNAILPKPVKGNIQAHGPHIKPTGGPFLPDMLITGRMDNIEEDDDRAHYRIPYEYEELRLKILERKGNLKVPQMTQHAQILHRSASQQSLDEDPVQFPPPPTP